MKNRTISLMLAVVMMLGFMLTGPVTANATQTMTVSDEAIRILKAEEGFSAKPYWDYAHWTVGYGTTCPADKLDEYTANGITVEEAEQLLRQQVAQFEAELHKFFDRVGITVTQNQFDALLLFSYNCGTGWCYETSGVFYNAIASQATGNTLINAFARWCNAGGQILTGLLRRRLSESNMYLNGTYSQTPPANFAYTLFDGNGGVSNPNVQGYDTNLTAPIIPVPTYTGYSFDGWYTAKNGGTKVTVLDESTKNGRLYAHWKDGQGNELPTEQPNGVTVVVTGSNVYIRSGPGTGYASVGMAQSGQQLVITQTAEGSGYTWGKTSAGWICLKYTNYAEATKPEVQEPPVSGKRMGTVKVNDVLRVRSGPSTAYSVAGYLHNGDRVEILEEKIVGAMVWGKVSNGWISMDYVVLDPVKEETTPPVTQPTEPETEPTEPETQPTEPETEPTEPETEPTEPETEPTEPETKPTEPQPEPPAAPVVRTGIVKVNDLLRVRSGPSTSAAVVGYYSPKTKVTITEQTTTGSMTWGKTAKGWVSMDYITLDPISTGGNTSGSTGTTGQVITGTVNVKDYLRIRSGAGTSYSITGYLSPNEKVTITEQKTVGGTTWGKMSKGWISMDYVKVTGTTGGSASGSTGTAQTITGTIIADCLRVRKAAGTSNTIVGYYYYGAKVTVLETTKVGTTTWGRTSKGWISMDYVK